MRSPKLDLRHHEQAHRGAACQARAIRRGSAGAPHSGLAMTSDLDVTVPTDGRALVIHFYIIAFWRRTLWQRSQNDRTGWTRIKRLANDFLPASRVTGGSGVKSGPPANRSGKWLEARKCLQKRIPLSPIWDLRAVCQLSIVHRVVRARFAGALHIARLHA